MSSIHRGLPYTCPLCLGRVEPFHGPNNHIMATCEACGVSFVIPATAWDVARQRAIRQLPPDTENSA